MKRVLLLKTAVFIKSLSISTCHIWSKVYPNPHRSCNSALFSYKSVALSAGWGARVPSVVLSLITFGTQSATYGVVPADIEVPKPQ